MKGCFLTFLIILILVFFLSKSKDKDFSYLNSGQEPITDTTELLKIDTTYEWKPGEYYKAMTPQEQAVEDILQSGEYLEY